MGETVTTDGMRWRELESGCICTRPHGDARLAGTLNELLHRISRSLSNERAVPRLGKTLRYKRFVQNDFIFCN